MSLFSSGKYYRTKALLVNMDVSIHVIIAIALLLISLRLSSLFRKKYIYFVRHGETILNAARIRQDDKGFLSEAGIMQAKSVGLRMAQMHIQHMYVSPFERTVQTADIMNTYIQVPITYTALLAERKNPSQIVGKSYDDLEVKQITDQMDLAYHDPHFRITDEENFSDMKLRAKKLLRYLAFRPYVRIVCVTHSIFLRMVLGYMQDGENLDVPTYVKLAFLHTVNNAGITLVTYNPWRMIIGKSGYEIIVFNDVSKV